MTKAWCIWCETGEMPKHGYYWICPACFDKITELELDINSVIEYMKGIRPRVLKNGTLEERVTVEQFIADMYDFHRRGRNTRKLIKAITQGLPIEPLEQSLSISKEQEATKP